MSIFNKTRPVLERITADKALKLLKKQYGKPDASGMDSVGIQWRSTSGYRMYTLIEYRGKHRSLEFDIPTSQWWLEVRREKRY